MDDLAIRNIWIIIAVATPVLATLIGLAGHWAAAQEGGRMSRRLRRNCLILFLAGPANLVLWLLFNDALDAVGYRSVLGIVVAAVVFVAAGLGTGFFSRVAGHGWHGQNPDGDRPGAPPEDPAGKDS
ncbi:MAG: hypothetical protein M1457_04190 [bacterium]|nr:hypothetical protein [bacterium]